MSFRFVEGDRVRVISDDVNLFTGRTGEVIIIEYIPEDGNPFDSAEYTVEFDEPVPNPAYNGNEEWELPEYPSSYFSDSELEPAGKKKLVKRTSGFGKFINRIEKDD